ncbi:AI-2E family transporter [Halomarina halobia]|uniref:AI-2E family transporter n=1 Tax=Halomarina halobia TaxID=3033386 RepID=A0ABD6ACN8_9EURY|nr:AI-2E family transporter [Halomarina sp. PSR21]
MTPRFDRRVDRLRAALWVAAVVILGVLLFVAYSYAGTVILALFIYYVTRPIYSRLRRVIPSRTLAVFVALVVVTLPAVVVFGWTLALALQELFRFAESGALDPYRGYLQPYIDFSTLAVDIDTLVREGLRLVESGPPTNGYLQGALDALAVSFGLLAGVGIHLFIALALAFYLLRDDHRIAQWTRETFGLGGTVVETYVRTVDRDLKNVFFGNILNAFLTGAIGTVAYTLLDAVAPSPVVAIPAPALLGMLTGVASLVPVVGMKLVYVPVFLALLARGALDDPAALWFPLAFAAVSIVIVDTIPDLVLRPIVSGRTLHVGALMLAYLFGPLLFGWYGVFLGPFLLVVVLEFARVVVPWLLDPERDVTTTLPEFRTVEGNEDGVRDRSLVDPTEEGAPSK